MEGQANSQLDTIVYVRQAIEGAELYEPRDDLPLCAAPISQNGGSFGVQDCQWKHITCEHKSTHSIQWTPFQAATDLSHSKPDVAICWFLID